MSDGAGLLLTREGEDDRPAPSLAEIFAALEALSPDEGCGFVILQRDGRDYVQVAGGDDAYTVEWREHPAGNFRHWVAGRMEGPPGSGPRYATIVTSCAPIRVPANEQLAIDDVKAIFKAFTQGEPRPAIYLWREITAQFR